MPADVVKFGDDLEIDRVAYELRRSGRPLKLERIPMEILSLLIERHGQLVSRDDIIERIWGKDVFLDTDNSINSAIRKIRQVLKDDPESPAFIQTVTGKGYRFIAPVPDVVRAVTVPEVLPTSDEVHDTAAPATASSPAVGPAQSPPRWIRSAFLLLLLVLWGWASICSGLGTTHIPSGLSKRRCWRCCPLPTSVAILSRSTSAKALPRRRLPTLVNSILIAWG